FGYAINISKCKGYRDCVYACVKENNLGRDSQMQYIRVLEMEQGTHNLEKSDHYYENSPCTKACPVEATWREPDGIVVIDYDWCIGCRMCMSSCPYWARHFNWTEPELPSEEVNPLTHYLGNRPRMRGVTEKCHFCIHRTRKGRLPACAEACPNGARIFGTLVPKPVRMAPAFLVTCAIPIAKFVMCSKISMYSG
ncbi:MAG: 4Fe-4S dicluster domain-containing protein, partial [Planctomycetota bacterium]